MIKLCRIASDKLTNIRAAVSGHIQARHQRLHARVVLATAALVAVLVAPAIAAPTTTQLPTGGQVVAGQAGVTQSGATMTVNQTSQRAAINWQTFDVGSEAQVNFVQPDSNSAILNRVTGPDPSQIFGRINANGQVFLINPSGVYFSPGSSVNVGSFTATTHDIDDNDFMDGNLTFTRNGATGSIVNDGTIVVDLKGYVALLAPEVRNNGVILAQMGTVAMAAGEAYELQFDQNNRLINIRVEPATVDHSLCPCCQPVEGQCGQQWWRTGGKRNGR